jgi:hypothetical protein
MKRPLTREIKALGKGKGKRRWRPGRERRGRRGGSLCNFTTPVVDLILS